MYGGEPSPSAWQETIQEDSTQAANEREQFPKSRIEKIIYHSYNIYISLYAIHTVHPPKIMALWADKHFSLALGHC